MLGVLLVVAASGYYNVFYSRVPPFRSEWGLLFTSNRVGSDNDIFLFQNGRVRWLTQNDVMERDAVWSPDGVHVLYSGYGGDSVGLYLLNIETGETKRLTDSSSGGVFSPDGEKIAFTSNRRDPGGYPTDLYVLTLNPQRTLTRVTPEMGEISNASWSPSSTQLVFGYAPYDADGRARSSRDIYTADLTESPPVLRNLTNAPNNFDTMPVWSPDGVHITFISDRDGQQNTHLLTVATGETRLLLPPSLLANRVAAWSADGRRVAVPAYSGSAAVTNGLDLFIVDVYQPDAPPVRLTSTEMNETQPTWSPDGSQIAFVHDQRITGRFMYAGRCEVVVVDLASRIQQQVLRAQEGICDTAPQWQP